jgi:hypothetical protein
MADDSSVGTQARVPVLLGCPYESRKMFARKTRIYDLALLRTLRVSFSLRPEAALGTLLRKEAKEWLNFGSTR